MKIKSTSLGLIVVIILFGGIFGSSAFNMWKTESVKVPKQFSEGEFTGQYDPADIRGSYSFDDVSSAFNIPIEDLKNAFGLSAEIDTSIFKNKDLAELYGDLGEIENASVKLFVALYTRLPYEMDEETYLPTPAVEILKTKGSLTQDEIKYFDSHMIDIDRLSQNEIAESSDKNNDNTASNTQGTNEDHSIEDKLVRGETTFKEVLDWGVSKEIVEKIIGGEIPDTNIVIRDYCRDKGLQFSIVKENLQNEID